METILQYGLTWRLAEQMDQRSVAELVDRVARKEDCLQTAQFEFTSLWRKLFDPGKYDSHRLRLYLLESEDGIAGFGRLFPDVVSTPLRPVGNIGVVLDKPWRRKGLGSFLLDSLIRIAVIHGCQSLRAHILPHNLPSQRLFEKFGFEQIDSREIFWPKRNSRIEELILERKFALTGLSTDSGSSQLDGEKNNVRERAVY